MSDSDNPDWDEHPPEGHKRVRFYRFRNRLRDKAGGGANQSVIILPEVIARAEATFHHAAKDYPKYVQGTVEHLVKLCADAAGLSPDQRDEHFRQINHAAHEFKGQGGTFGYPLITTFADSLYKFTGVDAPHTDAYLELVRAHVDAIKAVIVGQIAGDGGDTGRELQRVLQRAIRKYAPASP
jgi:chemotaxis protein histidine kinase CheA